jgi:hypothetical protein
MTELKQKLLEFTIFLEENSKELVKEDYAACLEDITGLLTEITDRQEMTRDPIRWDLGFNSDCSDNEDD